MAIHGFDNAQQKYVFVRWVMKIDGKDRYTVEMFQASAGGTEAKVLALEGKRTP